MLLDSNVIIYAAKPGPYAERARAFVAANTPAVSAVSRVGTLGFPGLGEAERLAIGRFFAASDVLPVSDEVVDAAVALRQQQRMSLGDSLIAATAQTHGLRLVTRNTRDFRWIGGLVTIDPFE